jgi:hypothetical protein
MKRKKFFGMDETNIFYLFKKCRNVLIVPLDQCFRGRESGIAPGQRLFHFNIIHAQVMLRNRLPRIPRDYHDDFKNKLCSFNQKIY